METRILDAGAARQGDPLGLQRIDHPRRELLRLGDEGAACRDEVGQGDGVRIKVQFDSGASTSNLTYAAARRAHIDPDGPQTTSGGFISGAGRHMVESRITPVDTFELGSEKIQNTRLRLAKTLFGETDMLLGADFFLSHRIYVSKDQRKIYFTYNGGPDE